MKNYIHQFLLLFLLNNIYSQQSNKYIFRVLDKETKEPQPNQAAEPVPEKEAQQKPEKGD